MSMAETPRFIDPSIDFDAHNPLRADAIVVAGTTRRGKHCELIDNTGAKLPRAELEAIFSGLIENDVFGFHPVSAGGADAIRLERREGGHVQVGDNLYRLIVYRYQARLEPF